MIFEGGMCVMDLVFRTHEGVFNYFSSGLHYLSFPRQACTLLFYGQRSQIFPPIHGISLYESLSRAVQTTALADWTPRYARQSAHTDTAPTPTASPDPFSFSERSRREFDSGISIRAIRHLRSSVIPLLKSLSFSKEGRSKKCNMV